MPTAVKNDNVVLAQSPTGTYSDNLLLGSDDSGHLFNGASPTALTTGGQFSLSPDASNVPFLLFDDEGKHRGWFNDNTGKFDTLQDKAGSDMDWGRNHGGVDHGEVSVASLGPNLILNGTFDTSNSFNSQDWTLAGGLDSWTNVTGNALIMERPGFFPLNDGTKDWLNSQTYSNGSVGVDIKQDFNVAGNLATITAGPHAGANGVLTFDLATEAFNGNQTPANETVDFKINGVDNIVKASDITAAPNNFEHFSVDVSNLHAGSNTLEIIGGNAPTFYGLAIDKVGVQAFTTSHPLV